MSITKRARPILEAAARWKQTCLLENSSVLSRERLWTSENFDALDRHFVQRLDFGEGDFFQKLKKQLESAPAQAMWLAAELLWVMYLIVVEEAMRGETKRSQIKTVWEWSGTPLPADSPELGEVLEQGLSHPGTAYHTHRWRELRFFITAMEAWFARDTADRRQLLENPWSFASWLDQQEYASGRQLRHALLFLLFPAEFQPVLTKSHKKEIVEGFFAYWNEPVPADTTNLLQLDQCLLEVTRRLEHERPGQEVDFYRSPLRETWQSAEADGPHEAVGGEGDWTLGDGRAWMISAGEGGRLWSEFKEKGLAAIGSDDVGDLSEYGSHGAVHAELVRTSGNKNPVNDSLALWQFSHELTEGDILVVKQGRSRLLGYGRVVGPYRYEPQRAEYPHTVAVDWSACEPVELPGGHGFAIKTLTDVSPWKERVAGLIQLLQREQLPPDPADSSYTIEMALDELFLTPHQFSQILDTLGRRKNLILQGPPGVGKTFVARRIAWSLIKARDPGKIEMVQFHQSYAYEDFVQGWRPTESGGFRLRNGVFHEFCRRASQDTKTPYVFIIDEINRGNLSRIFGELLMLIEADKRGPEHAIPLTYAQDDERFAVPPNVHLLGLMNTADRSLAMVDYALRRRFAFVDLEPAFGTEGFRQCLSGYGADESLINLIDERMTALNRKICEDTKNLGRGYQIGHSYFVPADNDDSIDLGWYNEIVRTQVAPLLHEYWFDHPDRVADLVSGLTA